MCYFTCVILFLPYFIFALFFYPFILSNYFLSCTIFYLLIMFNYF
uniref:Uncharacterized protein n=1 Tax=Anguilla anguilla TaxID=7936 RepID=A0A0E9S1U7_ANGAN